MVLRPYRRARRVSQPNAFVANKRKQLRDDVYAQREEHSHMDEWVVVESWHTRDCEGVGYFVPFAKNVREWDACWLQTTPLPWAKYAPVGPENVMNMNISHIGRQMIDSRFLI